MRKKLFMVKERLTKTNTLEKVEFIDANYGKKFDDERRFSEFLNYAKNHTGFYANYLENKKMYEYPILTKQTLKENYEGFFSDEFEKKNLRLMTTSGSYGTPFKFYLSKEKKEMQHAEVIYFSRWAKFDIGVKHGYVASKVKSKKDQFIQNQLSIAPFVMTDEWLKEEVIRIKKSKLKVLIGYPSAISTISKYMISRGIFIQLEGIITISEILTLEARESIEKAFGVKPISRYSTEEFGVLAIECPSHNKHHLNNLNYIIELINPETNCPSKPGEIGKVIVTDLNSYAMPLIRYDTGDLAVKGSGDCSCGLKTPYLEKLVGRQLEQLYSTNGTKIASMALNGKMRDIENVLQFQINQVGLKEYDIKLVTLNDFNEEAEVDKRYRELFGEDSIINIKFMKDIKPLNSGKRPYIIQSFHK